MKTLRWLCCCFLLLAGNPLFAQAPLTPAQTASLRRETQQAQGRYVREVSKILGVKESVVRQSLPDRARITDPVSRMIVALEHRLGQPLTEEQKNAIRTAEAKYSASVQEAQKSLRSK